jgi:hypothetical protein
MGYSFDEQGARRIVRAVRQVERQSPRQPRFRRQHVTPRPGNRYFTARGPSGLFNAVALTWSDVDEEHGFTLIDSDRYIEAASPGLYAFGFSATVWLSTPLPNIGLSVIARAPDGGTFFNTTLSRSPNANTYDSRENISCTGVAKLEAGGSFGCVNDASSFNISDCRFWAARL